MRSPYPGKPALLLGKLIPRLGCDHDGEVVAIARAITRHLQARGLDLHDLTRAVLALPAPGTTPADDPEFPPAWWGKPTPMPRLTVWNLSCMLPELTTKEARFVDSLGAWLRAGGEPSPKQLAWLRAIYSRVMGSRP